MSRYSFFKWFFLYFLRGVAVQEYYLFSFAILFILATAPKEVFVPRPKVDSAVLRLDVRKEHPVELVDEDIFFKCIKSGFEQRRKTLLNSLTGTAGLGKDQIREILEDAGIDATRRIETMDLQELADLANSMAKYLNK